MEAVEVCHKYHFCRDKYVFFATKHVFCRDKSMLAATKLIRVASPTTASPGRVSRSCSGHL